MSGRLLIGHVLEELALLEPESVQMCVTSPPYWGLRKYAGEQDATWPDGTTSPFGLEPTIEGYVSHSVEVLRAVRRVLRDDGVCFWNLGDSYSGSGQGGNENMYRGDAPVMGASYRRDRRPREDDPHKGSPGLKPKDLCLLPFRVALAAQADGWWVRSDIIWSKPNPMPESVTDRPTTSHEHILLLTKGATYFWDAEAVREAASWKAKEPDGWDTGPGTHGTIHREGRGDGKTNGTGSGRNLRSVWTFSTAPYPEAHFATFPPELPRRCILAGSPTRVCGKCGKGFTSAMLSARMKHENETVITQQSTIQTELQCVRDVLRGTQPNGLQPEVPCGRAGNETTPKAQGLPSVRQAVLEEGREPILQSSVRGELESGPRAESDLSLEGEASSQLQGRENIELGVHINLLAGSPIGSGEAKEVRSGASPCDGIQPRALSGAGGIGASQERNQERQPNRESGANDGESAQGECDLPSLRQEVLHSLSPCCGAPLVPATILDPFAGSGTSLFVAEELGRDWIGIDISREYEGLIRKRLKTARTPLVGLEV
jgi:DNA modification methylase